MKICSNNKWPLGLTIATILIMAVVAVTVTGLKSLRLFNKRMSKPTEQVQMKHLGQLPLMFIENLGQWDSKVAYMARKQGMSAWLQKDGITFRFEKRNACNLAQGVTIQMTFEGASERVLLEGEGRQSSKHNFFIGKDRSQWRSGVSSYAKVVYDNLYDGIDLCVREQEGWLEYDVLLSEGADLSDVVICCEGLKGLMIDENGILVMETEFGLITQKPPKAWYALSSGEKMPVDCAFCQIDNCRYGFEVPESDLALALVIDPGLEWSTFCGADLRDYIPTMALDNSGNAVLAGYTESANFPCTTGAYDTTFNGGENDGCVFCISADGSQLLWSTYIGGSDSDIFFKLALDDSNRVTVGGYTLSPDFPTSPPAYDTMHNGLHDAMVVRLSADGSQLIYSTYLGSDGSDWILALDMTASGEAIVYGCTDSPNFPTTSGAYDTTFNGVRDFFVTRLNADASDLIFSTFLGGTNTDGFPPNYPVVMNMDYAELMCDVSGDVIVTGATLSSDFPVIAGAYDTTWNGYVDCFITRLDASGSNLVYSTFLGGTGLDAPMDIAVDEDDRIIICGWTQSNDLPTTLSAYDTTYNGGPGDGFLAILDNALSNLLYSTYLGGPSTEHSDIANCIAPEASGTLIIIGACGDGFPVTPGAYDTTHNGYQDIFLCRLSPEGNRLADLMYSSYIGGALYDHSSHGSLVADSTVVIAGYTSSGDFPTTPGAYDPIYADRDAFICRFGVYVGIQEKPAQKPLGSIMLSPVFPNPSYGRFNYTINLTQASKVNVCIVDVTGRLIETLINEQLPAGTYHFSWRPSKELANGAYFLKLEAGNYSATEKLVLIR